MRALGSLAAAVAATVAIVVAGMPAYAVTNTPPRSMAACAGGKVTKACESAALADFARARAKEGLAPMVLPTNFARLSPGAQMFVLTDLDRVDRGRAPIAALDKRLDAIARGGARRHADPSFPRGSYSGGSNYADVLGSTLYSEYEWVYDDGPGSPNVDCVTRADQGCWGHRRNVLARYPAPSRMGAARAGTDIAEILMGPAPKRYRRTELTWRRASSRIPVGVTTHALSNAGTLGVYASGLSMTVHASITGRWSVSRRTFHLRAGHRITLRLSGSGAGVLRLRGPNGTVSVTLG